MNFHNITYPDMNNGSGLRVVLWLSGCDHRCKGCQNPQTWDVNSGIPFDEKAEQELFEKLDEDYISGITLTGGDPLNKNNLDDVLKLVNKIHLLLPEKTIWLYTGYTVNIFESSFSDHTEIETIPKSKVKLDLTRAMIISKCDVVVDGRFEEDKKDLTLRWRGSSNQHVIDIKKSLNQKKVVLWCD